LSLTTSTTIEKAPLTFVNFIKDTRKSHLGTFILFVSLYTFSVNLAGPLFASHMLTDLKFSYITFTAVVSCEYIARILSLTFWGRLVDKTGSLKILSQVSYVIPLVPILWIFSPNFFYLIGVQLLSGVVWAAFDLSVQTFIYKATQPNQRLRYIVYYRSLTSFSVALGSITGAFMLNYMFSIFGSPLLGMFLISGLLRMVVARVMLPRLTLQGIPDAVIHPELAVELATVPPIARPGLYYYPDLWRRITRRTTSVGSKVIGKAFSTIGFSKDGLFYKPAKWSEYLINAGMQPKEEAYDASQNARNNLFHKPGKWMEYLSGIGAQQEKAESKIVQPIRDGLFYHKEGWAKFQEELHKRAASNDSASGIDRKGLFHDPQRWGEYMKQSLALNATTMHTGGEGTVLRQPIFYHPEIWDKYQRETTARKSVNAPVTSSRKALLYHPDEWQKLNEKSDSHKNRKTSPQAIGISAAQLRTTVYKKPQTLSPAPRSIGNIPAARFKPSLITV
jgi:hypothetical protein